MKVSRLSLGLFSVLVISGTSSAVWAQPCCGYRAYVRFANGMGLDIADVPRDEFGLEFWIAPPTSLTARLRSSRTVELVEQWQGCLDGRVFYSVSGTGQYDPGECASGPLSLASSDFLPWTAATGVLESIAISAQLPDLPSLPSCQGLGNSVITSSASANLSQGDLSVRSTGEIWSTLKRRIDSLSADRTACVPPAVADLRTIAGYQRSAGSVAWRVSGAGGSEPTTLELEEVLGLSGGMFSQIGPEIGDVTPPPNCPRAVPLEPGLRYDAGDGLGAVMGVVVLVDGQVVFSAGRAVTPDTELLTGFPATGPGQEFEGGFGLKGNVANWVFEGKNATQLIIPASSADQIVEVRFAQYIGARTGPNGWAAGLVDAPCVGEGSFCGELSARIGIGNTSSLFHPRFDLNGDGFINEADRALAPAVCCLADVTGIGGDPAVRDGLVTGDDFTTFLNWFAEGDLRADLVGIGGTQPPDGVVDGEDFNAFINAFAAGCD